MELIQWNLLVIFHNSDKKKKKLILVKNSASKYKFKVKAVAGFTSSVSPFTNQQVRKVGQWKSHNRQGPKNLSYF